MKFIISGKNIEVSQALKDKITKKVGKLNKFFNRDTEVHVTMSVEKNRHILEVNIPHNSGVIRAEVTNEDMYASIDKAVDILERQIERNKTKSEKKMFSLAGSKTVGSQVTDETEEDDFKIIRTRKYAVKPMTVDEAILQLKLVKQEFLMFSNADTKKVNVIYKRKDGNIGLIEPEF